MFIIAIVSQAGATIGDGPADYAARYGPPLKESLDHDGYGVRIYHSPEFEEVRVIFAKGRGRVEQFKIAEGKVVNDAIVGQIRNQNPGQVVDSGSKYVTVGKDEPGRDLKFSERSGKKRNYLGTVGFREQDKERILVFHGVAVPLLGEWLLPQNPTGQEVVIEIPLHPAETEFNALEPGKKVTVTLLDVLSEDIGTRLAVVGRREHIDRDDAFDDAHSSFQQLLRISTGGQVLRDWSICSRHHIKMERRTVEIAYGLLGHSRAQSYCFDHFPNCREYAAGGCMTTNDSPQSTAMYICPKCVAECNQYKRDHPDENESPFD